MGRKDPSTIFGQDSNTGAAHSKAVHQLLRAALLAQAQRVGTRWI
jgi:hypothetical protein